MISSSGGRRLRPAKRMPFALTETRRSKTLKYIPAASPSRPRISSSDRAWGRRCRQDVRLSQTRARPPSAWFSGCSLAARRNTVRQLTILPVMKARAKGTAPSVLSVLRYCSRRSSTLPVVGPCIEAMKRPFSVSQDTATPFRAQWPSKKELQVTCPKQTSAPMVWMGILPSSRPSARRLTHSPSLDSQVFCVVTKSVLRWRFMARSTGIQDSARPARIFPHRRACRHFEGSRPRNGPVLPGAAFCRYGKVHVRPEQWPRFFGASPE